MKKWIAGLLTAALLVGVVPAVLAVETEDPAADVNFQVGYGEVDVTPEKENGTIDGAIHIAGNSDAATRTAQGVAADGTRLKMKAIALSDGKQTNVVMTTDFIRVPIDWNLLVEKEVLTDDSCSQYGLKAGFLSMSATHTHSSVDIGDAKITQSVSQPAKWHTSNDDGDNAGKDTTYFSNYWLPGAVAAVKAALEDLSSATIQTNSVTIHTGADENPVYNMGFVRHWLCSDGTIAGVNFVNTDSDVKGHFRPSDPEMQLIRFKRGQADDIILVNWQTHPTGAMTSIPSDLSADYCGVLCNQLSERTGCQVAFFQGAAGNVNQTSQGGGTNPTLNPKFADTNDFGYEKFGKELADQAEEALKSMKEVPVGWVRSLRNETTVVERGYEGYRTIQQDVITIGNSVAFVTAGYEMFDSNGMDVKKATKAQFKDVRDIQEDGTIPPTVNKDGYAVVFVIENSQGHEYMPNWQTNHYTLLGGPEAYEVTKSCFNMVPGTAEDLANGLIHMLETLNPALKQAE